MRRNTQHPMLLQPQCRIACFLPLPLHPACHHRICHFSQPRQCAVLRPKTPPRLPEACMTDRFNHAPFFIFKSNHALLQERSLKGQILEHESSESTITDGLCDLSVQGLVPTCTSSNMFSGLPAKTKKKKVGIGTVCQSNSTHECTKNTRRWPRPSWLARWRPAEQPWPCRTGTSALMDTSTEEE